MYFKLDLDYMDKLNIYSKIIKVIHMHITLITLSKLLLLVLLRFNYY